MSDRTLSPLVLKIGGAALEDPARARDLWRALAECHAVLRGRLVLVHGGGVLVDRHLERLGMKTERRDGIRVTPPDHADEIAAVLAGRVNHAIVGALTTHGLKAVGLSLGDGGLTKAARATHYAFDPGQVGTITGGDPAILNRLMDGGFLPVVSSIAFDADGAFLNVNADDAAAAIASIARARTLVLLTDVPGILDEHKQPIPRISPEQIEALIARGVITGGMIPKAQAAARTATATGVPTAIASFNHPADIVRIARGESAGTTVTPASTPARTLPVH